MTSLIKFWCEECGGDRLDFDAVVTWDFENQKYEFQAFGDRAWCGDCFTDQPYCEGTEEQCREARDRYEEKVEAEWKS